MRYKLFGHTGLRVSELCLGTMTFGESRAWGSTQEESRKIFNTFAEAGGNFIDTANHYTDGQSEEWLGHFLTGHRNEFVLGTKYTFSQRPNDPNAGGNHRKSLFEAVHNSLRRLKTDYIDIFWMHAWDNLTPIEETLRALDDLVRAGKVLYIAASDTPAWVIAKANTLANSRGWTAFSGVQLEYNLAERASEREFFGMARHLDLAVVAWSPLAGGLFSGKYSKAPGEPVEKTARLYHSGWDEYLTERNYRIADEVVSIAKEIRKTPSQVALAWIKKQHEALIPILGARRQTQIEDNLGCLDVELYSEALQRLEQVSRIDRGFPEEFLNSPSIEKLIYGNTRPLIDNHRRT